MAAISAFGTEEADREAALVGGLIRAVRGDGELRRLMHENVLDGPFEALVRWAMPLTYGPVPLLPAALVCR